jgi:ADP-ribosylglycohydrolase
MTDARTPLRLTWVQPEDLLGHELRQAREDGRADGLAATAATAGIAGIAARWRAAGGQGAPPRAGASPSPASPELRALAAKLLTELTELTEPAALPSGSSAREPTDLPAIKALCPDWPRAEGGPRDATAAVRFRQRLERAWLGRAVGCLLGKPVEKLPLAGIRALAKATGNWPVRTWFTARGIPPELAAAYPFNRRSAATSLAENIDGMPEDDDLNYPLLNLLLLQRHGRDFTTADVARLWLDELPAGRTFTAERIAYRNLLHGLEPPHTATHHNPFREWIGALIRADVHGWTNPGSPAAAAEQAHRDATLSHTANGVYGAMFVAAVIAEAATGTADIHRCLRTGLAVVPPHSRLHQAISDAVQLARAERDFDRVVDHLHTAHGAYHWVHVVPNTALLAAALTHADGDFELSVCNAVSGGWDTDSNGATAGSIAGILSDAPLPPRWTEPLKNRLTTSVAGFDGTGFDTLADLTAGLALGLTDDVTAGLTHRETHRP